MTFSDWVAGLPFFRAREAPRHDAADAGEPIRPLLVFDHIPKTAGTTFRRAYLTCALPRGERWILSGSEHNERELEQLMAMSPRKRRRLRVVAGHGADWLRPHLPGARYITLVRDPVERAISSYLHARFHEGGDALWAPVRQEGLGLAEFVQRYELPNAQSRQLLGADHDVLDAADIVRRLDVRYALVGCTEAFAEFVFVLHATEGLPLCLFNNRLVRAERASYVPPPSDLEVVRRLNAADSRLHAIVRREFRARVDRLPSWQQDRLARYVRALHAFQAETQDDVTQAVRLDDSARGGRFRHLVSAVLGTPTEHPARPARAGSDR